MIRKHFAIVGLGLMGGSLAIAIRPFVHRLTGVDIDLNTRKAAADLVDWVTDDFGEGVRKADVIILAAPVRTILDMLSELPRIRPDGCMVLDIGSTKAQVCQAMEALPPSFQAIGGHPLCGKETGGFAAAAADLFQRQSFVLCRHRRTGEEIEELAVELIGKIGARPVFLPAELHDELLAATSHLPYVVAAVLVQTVYALGDPLIWEVSASGFRDTSRLASSDPKMILDILLTNRLAILEKLGRYQKELAQLIDLLQSANESALTRWLTYTQRQHTKYREATGQLKGQ